MSPDRHDELADALFAAARRERASAALRGQTLRALAENRVAPGRWRPLVAAALAACLGAGLLVGLRPSPSAPRISAESDSVRAVPPRHDPASPMPNTPASGRLPVAVAPSAAVPRAKPVSAAPVAPATLEQELGFLDGARRDVAAGNPRGALARLDDYEKVAKSGSLAAEARLLRIQVLAKAGERTRAAALARKFIADYPDSPLTDRARSYAADEDDPSSGVQP